MRNWSENQGSITFLRRGESAHDVVVRHLGEQSGILEFADDSGCHDRSDEVFEFVTVHRIIGIDSGVRNPS